MVRAFAFEIKSLTLKGEFTGLASVYNVVDLGDDLVEPGAFTKTIQQSGKDRPLLWRHDAPIGMVSLRDTSTALEVDGRLSLGVAAADEALVLMKTGVVQGLSIGFQAVREEMVGAVRHLKEIKLWEISLVCFPMCEQATVTSVKAAQQAEEQKAVRLLQQMLSDVKALAKR